MKDFKSTPETDKKLNKVAEFMSEAQLKLMQIADDLKANSFDWHWCDTCPEYIHEDDQVWMHSDLAVCPKCGGNLEL